MGDVARCFVRRIRATGFTRAEESLDLATIGGHFGEACWYKLAAGLYPGNQSAQRDALIADLGVQLPEDQAEWDWIEASYQRAVDPFFWVNALGRLSAYNETVDPPQTNAEAKDWMRDAETRTFA